VTECIVRKSVTSELVNPAI